MGIGFGVEFEFGKSAKARPRRSLKIKKTRIKQ